MEAGPSTSTIPPVPSALPANSGTISSLFDALVKAGVVSATGNAASDGSGAKEGDAEPQKVDVDRESARAYRKAILAQKIKLTSADITK
jgi:pre-mRNA cleavage complex 2 protein Pcf11